MPRVRDNPIRTQENTGELREASSPPVEEITGDNDLREFYRGREINRGMPTKILDSQVEKLMQAHGRNSENMRTFVIRQEGEIVAGGQMELQESSGQTRAYLGKKFVNPDQRGQNFDAVLVKRRLDAAREAGAKLAYSLVEKTNIAALRSITKDGFDLSSLEHQPEMEHLKEEEYFASRDLTSNNPPSKIEMARVLGSIGKADLSGNELLIDLNDKQAIEEAFTAGFVGKFVFKPKELPQVDRVTMYLEKELKK